MAQIQWQNVAFNPRGGGNTDVDIDFTPIGNALAKYQEKKAMDSSMATVQRALGVTDPDLYQKALAAGAFGKIDANNVEILKTRASDLLAQQLAKLTQTETTARIEGIGITNEGNKIINRNNLTVGEQNRLDLEQDKITFDQGQTEYKLRPEVAKRLGTINDMATTNYKGAMSLMNSPETQEMLAKANIPLADRERMLTNLGVIATEGRTQDTEVRDKAHLEDVRPIKEQNALQTEVFLGRGAKRTEALDIADDAAALATKALAEKMRPGTEQDTIDAAERERLGLKRTDFKNDAEFEAAAKAIIDVKKADEWAQKNIDIGDPADIDLAISRSRDLTPEQKVLARASVGKALAEMSGMTPEKFVTEMQLNAPAGAPTGRRTQPGATSPQVRAATDSIVGLADKYEGGGRYDTLFGHSQRTGGAFEGVDVTKQTIGNLDRFAQEQYGPYVRGEIGRTATPMGRFQIVNSTLQQAAKELGLSPDTLFDESTQNLIFQHLVQKRIGGPREMGSKIQGLRQEWEGFKNVSDADLATAITNWEAGDRSGLTNVMTGGGTVTPATPVDESYGAAATAALSEFGGKIAAKQPLDLQETQVVQDIVRTSDNLSMKAADTLQTDSLFGGKQAAIMAAIRDTKNQTISTTAAVAQMKEAIPDIQVDQLNDDINYIVDKYQIPPGVAAALVAAAPVETHWISSKLVGFEDERHIDRGKMDDLVSKFIDPNEKDSDKKVAGILAYLEQDRAKVTAAGNLANAQATTREAWTNYVQMADRAASGAPVNVERAYKKLQLAIQTEAAERERIANDKLLSVNRNASNPGAVATPVVPAPVVTSPRNTYSPVVPR